MSTPAPTPPRSGRLPLLAVLLVAVAAGVGLWAGERWFSSVSAQPALATAVMYGAPRALPQFQLQGPQATPVTNASLQGRWHLAFIGFLHCPDVCPTTLATLGQAMKQLEDLPETQRPRVFFLSVDPGRDTPDAVGSYAHHFNADTLAATGDKAQIDPLVQSLGMLYVQRPLEGDGYTVDHSPTIALINPLGQMAGMIRPPLDPAKIAADLRKLATP